MSHEFSTVMVSGMRRALLELGWLDQVKAEASAPAKEALDAPEGAKFHPGPAMNEVVDVVARLHGLEGAERFMRSVTANSMEGIVAPLARVYRALKGDSPRVLLAQLDSLLKVAARGLKAAWLEESERAGVLSIVYPEPTSLPVGYAWRGVVQHLLVFCEANGGVEVIDFGEGGRTVRLRVKWD